MISSETLELLRNSPLTTLAIMCVIARVEREGKALNGIPRKKKPLSPSGMGAFSVLAGEEKGRLAIPPVLGGILS